MTRPERRSNGPGARLTLEEREIISRRLVAERSFREIGRELEHPPSTVSRKVGRHGFGWHAFRRKWAKERKHHPDADVAAAGGWKSTEAVRLAYQHADLDTQLQVVMDAGELRRVDGQ